MQVCTQFYKSDYFCEYSISSFLSAHVNFTMEYMQGFIN